jgi:BspA type Leucine rich repeat region (6 copies)
MSQYVDISESQRIKKLKDRTIFAGYVANKTLLLQGVGQFPEKIEGGTGALTPSHYAVLNLGEGAVYTTVAEYDAIIAQNTIMPTNIPVVITPTILEYITDQGPSIVWNEVTFTRNTNLANFSYSAFITSIPASTVQSESTAPDYTNLIGVTIGNAVASIGDSAFGGCTELAYVTFTPTSTVTSIGEFAFYRCSSLTSITIPNTVTSIGYIAFSRSGLISVIFTPTSKLGFLTTQVFDQCDALTSITIPSSVTSIGESAFGRCTALTSITIPTSVTIIDGNAFASSGLTSITIPNTVTSIVSGAFDNCAALASVTFTPTSTLTSIGEFAFFSCSSLTSITIPNSVTSIGPDAFQGSGLITVYISSATATALGKTSPTANPPGVDFFGKTVATVLPS